MVAHTTTLVLSFILFSTAMSPLGAAGAEPGHGEPVWAEGVDLSTAFPENAATEEGGSTPGDTVTCNLSELVLDQGNYYDGLRLLSDCLSQELPNPRRAHYLGLRGKLLLDIKRVDEAQQDFEEAIALGGDTANLYHGRGLCALDRGAFDDAVSDFHKVMSLEPQSPIGATAMARAHYLEGNRLDTKTFLDFALSIDPDYLPALLLRANTLFDTGEYRKSIVDLNAALETDPGQYEALHLRGKSFNKLGEFEPALSDLKKAVEIRPQEDEILTDLALALIGLRKLKEAKRTLDLAVELRPGNSRAYYLRGSLKLAQGKTEAGREDLKHAITINPEGDFVEHALSLLRPEGDG